MFLGVDLAHWEFLGLLFGLALALVEMSGWEMKRLRHVIGAVGIALAVSCVVLLFGFSGATLRSPITLHWPLVLPSDKPPALAPIVRSESSPEATPTPAYLAELATLKDDNAKLKAENARLKNRPPRTIMVRSTPVPSTPVACPSIAPVLFPKLINATDCDALTGAQHSVDIANEQAREFIKTKGNESMNNLDAVNEAAMINANLAQAVANLRGQQSRLCANVVNSTPAPTP